VLEAASGMGEVGEYMARGLDRFDFKSVTLTLPTRTFEKSLDIKVGDKDVKLIEVGPAHTRGDVLVYVPGARALFAGDIMFVDCTPIMWAGPVANWIAACDLILGMEVDAVVPGHGPITDKKGVLAIKNYFEYISAEAKKRYDANMSVAEASMDIDLGEYSSWLDAERIAINIDTLYREFSGDTSPANTFELFDLMIKVSKSF
jgi:cyclase